MASRSLTQLLSKLSPNRLFLIDGLGAVLSALMLGGVLAHWEPVFGMPKPELYVLAGIAVVFAVYSLLCSWRLKGNWRPFLLGIGFANFFYCGLTLGLVIWHWDSLTLLGILYFIGESLIVLSLVSIELKRASSLKSGVE